MRAETGPLRFDGDWCGVFIRGDDAAGYLAALRQLIGPNEPIQAIEGLDKAVARSLMALLSECREPNPEAQSAVLINPNGCKATA